jgi:hypothetical protein
VSPISAFWKRILPTVLTMLVGIATLALYFLPALMPESADGITLVRAFVVEVAVVIAGFAMLLGVLNLLSVHWGRIISRRRGWFYSFVTIAAAIVVIVLAIADNGVSGPQMTWFYQYGLYPLQASFTALLAFLLAFAAYRTLRLRRGLNALLFLLAALVVLAAQAVPGIPVMTGVRDWLVNVWATAGLRGVILGVALGTLATLVRVLLGFDRPASE